MISPSTNFCNLKCDERHTVCVHKPCRIKGWCGNGTILRLTHEEREFILDVHNKIRNKVASGETAKMKFLHHFGATNMNTLSYDLEMEFVAQCWANYCKPASDTCRMTQNFESVGQNIHYLPLVNNLTDPNNLNISVTSWYLQGSAVKPSQIRRYYKDFPNKKFFQLIWAETYVVGCGRTAYKKGLLIICNYGPSGIIEHEPVFHIGRIASRCEVVNKKYPALCGEVISINYTEWEDPFEMAANGISGKFWMVGFTSIILLNPKI